MNCYDCATLGQSTAAVAACIDCGAGLCVEHAVIAPRYLTRLAVINRVETVEPPARAMRCEICAAAQEALTGSEGARARGHRQLIGQR
jgi:hypothetical protein